MHGVYNDRREAYKDICAELERQLLGNPNLVRVDVDIIFKEANQQETGAKFCYKEERHE